MAFKLIENTFLQQISALFRRSPNQINQLLGSDAELLRLSGGSVLAVILFFRENWWPGLILFYLLFEWTLWKRPSPAQV